MTNDPFKLGGKTPDLRLKRGRKEEKKKGHLRWSSKTRKKRVNYNLNLVKSCPTKANHLKSQEQDHENFQIHHMLARENSFYLRLSYYYSLTLMTRFELAWP